MNINFAGPLADAAPHLSIIETLSPSRSEVLEDVIWPNVFRSSYFGIEDTKACSRNQHVNMRSVGARQTDPDTILAFLDKLESFSEANPDLTASLVIHRFATQKVLSVPDQESSYPHRGLKMHMYVNFTILFYIKLLRSYFGRRWTVSFLVPPHSLTLRASSQLEVEAESEEKGSIIDPFLDSARKNFTLTSGYEHPVVYVNFAHGDEGPAAWYGERNLERLAQLKQKWDPEGLFGFSNAVLGG